MRVMKKQKTSKQLLKHYFFILLFPPLLCILAVTGVLRLNAEDNIYTHNMAERLMQDDYRTIDTSIIEKHEGGVQVVDQNYRVIFSKGTNLFSSDHLSIGEWTQFLLSSTFQQHIISVDYNEKEQFWLIVSLPNRLRLTGVIRLNLNFQAYGLFFILCLVIIMLCTLLYARITAVRFIRPLRQLSDAAGRMKDGDLSARVPVGNNQEFSELEISFNHMAEQLEKQITLIEQSERNRKTLIQDISHDLKNPLTSIMGYAELAMAQQLNQDSTPSDYPKIIYENSIRANDLVADLFELSRLDSPDFKLEPVICDFAEYIRKEMIRMLPELEAAGLEPEFFIPEEKMQVRFDLKQMKRVLSNLLYNAIAHRGKDSRLEVRLEQQAGMARLTMANDCIKPSSSKAEQWPVPSVLVAQDGSLNPGGSGLGLVIVKKIIAAHGGTVTLTSHHQRFEIRIELPQM